MAGTEARPTRESVGGAAVPGRHFAISLVGCSARRRYKKGFPSSAWFSASPSKMPHVVVA